MEIRAIPTTYAGVNFRSRLEARWAAMFDLLGLRWDYEPPIDFAGWIPDFMITCRLRPVYVEIKPRRAAIPKFLHDFPGYPPYSHDHEFDHEDYQKAIRVSGREQVLLLGMEIPGQCGIGQLLDCPDGHDHWNEVFDAVGGFGPHLENWRKAGNIIKWMPRK